MGDEWKQEFPEETRELEIIRDSPDQETFYKRLADQQRFMGQSIRIPGEDAGDEDWKKFNEKITAKVPTLIPAPDYENEEVVTELFRTLGAPENAEGYKLPELELEDGISLNEELVSAFTEASAKANIPQKQYEAVVKSIHETFLDKAKVTRHEWAEGRESLKTELGSAYDDAIKAVDVLLIKTNAPEGMKKITETADAATLKWLIGLTKAVSEKSTLAEDIKNSVKEPKMTPAEAYAKISEIRNNNKHPYHNPNDPGYAAAKAHMRELYILADPEHATKPVEGARHSY